MTDDFTVTAIQGKGNSHHLPIPAENLKPIRTPAQIGAQRDHLAFMRPLRLLSSQQQAILAHDTVDPLVIDSGLAHAIKPAVSRAPILRYP